MNNIIQQDATDIAKQNYTEYSKYVIKTRCYPDIYDGCKAVHRRCIYASYKGLPRHLVKSTNAIGEIVKYHPHPSSIYDTLVGMASKYSCPFPVFDTKGNFGDNVNPPAAERYTELMLSDLAIDLYCSLADYSDMVLGETDVDEPKSLPALIPLCFLQGSYGIPTGMSVVNIPPLNPIDLLEYYISILKHKDIEYKPKAVVKPNIGNIKVLSTLDEWKSVLSSGEGAMKYAPLYEVSRDKKTVTIYGLPKGKDISDLFKLFSTEIEKEQIDLRDESTTKQLYIIEILPYQRINAKNICDKLDKFISTVKYKFIFSDGDCAVYASFYDVVKLNMSYLLRCADKKLNADRRDIQYRLCILETIEKMKKSNIKSIFDLSEEQAISYIVRKFNVNEDIARAVLKKPMSYLTREHEDEIQSLKNEYESLKELDNFDFLLKLYKKVLSVVKKKYGDAFLTNI